MASTACCSAFSPDGQYYAYCGNDGKLKIWETANGRLKHEYIPNQHLSSPCSVIGWIFVSQQSAGNASVKHAMCSLKRGLLLLYLSPYLCVCRTLLPFESTTISNSYPYECFSSICYVFSSFFLILPTRHYLAKVMLKTCALVYHEIFSSLSLIVNEISRFRYEY